MATFTIPRGDTTPVLEIALKVANSDPVTYWLGTAHKADGFSANGIHGVNFVMTNLDTGDVVVAKPIDGSYNATSKVDGGHTILLYAWRKADPNWPTDPVAFAGDTGVAGNYRGEFEVTFNVQAPAPAAPNTWVAGRKRTFPSTPGDELLIAVTEDLDGT
jgi:hypothetical protein